MDAYVPAPTVPAAPTGLGTTAVTAAGNDGIISGTAAGQEYRKQGDTNWIRNYRVDSNRPNSGYL